MKFAINLLFEIITAIKPYFASIDNFVILHFSITLCAEKIYISWNAHKTDFSAVTKVISNGGTIFIYPSSILFFPVSLLI